MTKRIHESNRKEAVDVGPFFGKESGSSVIRAWRGQVKFGVRDIHIATDHHLLVPAPQAPAELGERLCKAKLVRKPRGGPVAIWHVAGHQREITKNSGKNTALVVEAREI